MSMNGEYLRVTAAELARAIQLPNWALEFAEEVIDTEEESEPAPAEARHLSTHSAWHAIAFLLHRAGFPVDIVFGEKDFTDEDWGHGPAKYLDAERVRVAADALAHTSYEALIQGVDPAELTAAEIYPVMMWAEPDAFDNVRQRFAPVIPFFTAAAQNRDAMLIWVD
jgi:hypothetical protein